MSHLDTLLAGDLEMKAVAEVALEHVSGSEKLARSLPSLDASPSVLPGRGWLRPPDWVGREAEFNY